MKKNNLHFYDQENGQLVNKYSKRKNKKSELLNKYGINLTLLANLFGYKSVQSLSSSSKRDILVYGVEEVIKIIEANK